mmetsp:Transcript_43230/g.78666  ORF Transcript_43230/g.78666 Transcript_43230/m.78666 type:complete len:284 (-) Transcript_43230:165-1016(-)
MRPPFDVLSIALLVTVAGTVAATDSERAGGGTKLAAEMPCAHVRGYAAAAPRICRVALARMHTYDHVLDYIDQQRNRTGGAFKVIDVGGAMSSWSLGHRDAVVDAMYNPNELASVEQFVGDINEAEGWEELLRHVQNRGKFDFVICTHTLEDLRNPTIAARMLPQIAKAGFVAVPSKFRELAKFQWMKDPPNGWRGYFHHRWIFDFQDGELVAFPKLSVLDYEPQFDRIANSDRNVGEMQMWFQYGLPMRIINGDFMGPDSATALDVLLDLVRTGVHFSQAQQ